MIQNPSLAIIKFLLQQKNYVAYRDLITTNNKQEEDLYKILDKLQTTYNRDLSLDEYLLSLPEDLKELGVYLASLDIKDDLLQDLVTKLTEQHLAHKIALIAIDVSEGRKPYDSLTTILQETPAKQVEEDFNFVTDDLELLYENRVRKHGLRWRLGSLNRMLGSLRKGDFGFVFARPETGKTTFLASEITYFAEQLPEDAGPILWINNEEDGEKVRLRSIQAALGISTVNLYADIKTNKQRYQDTIKSRIKLVDAARITRQQIERMCKALQPSCIVIDQIDKVHGFDGDREDLRLGSIYQWARELAKIYCPVIGVTQADGSGEGKKWLTMENVANAKTAKQAEADWILGIGATHADGFEYVRHLHLSKNKLEGDEDTDPTLRHGKQDVLIQPDIARYRDYQ